MRLFHASGHAYKVGDLIEPRRNIMLNQYSKSADLKNWSNNVSITYIDSVLELTRQNYAPHKPSRLHSVFCFDNFETTKNFAYDHNMEYIFEIEPQCN